MVLQINHIIPNCAFKLCEKRRGGAPRPFSFENTWLEEEDLLLAAGQSWSRNGAGDFMRKMEDCSNAIDTWGRKLRSRYKLDIKKCREDLEFLRNSTDSAATSQYKEVNG